MPEEDIQNTMIIAKLASKKMQVVMILPRLRFIQLICTITKVFIYRFNHLLFFLFQTCFLFRIFLFISLTRISFSSIVVSYSIFLLYAGCTTVSSQNPGVQMFSLFLSLLLPFLFVHRTDKKFVTTISFFYLCKYHHVRIAFKYLIL
jgi:hypothetical protein